jgi:hypothetical protein
MWITLGIAATVLIGVLTCLYERKLKRRIAAMRAQMMMLGGTGFVRGHTSRAGTRR